MKPMKFKDLERVLVKQGAQAVRSGKGSHQIWKRGSMTAAVPLHRLVSPGTIRDIMKCLGIDFRTLGL